MDKLSIEQSPPLKGDVCISGAKNAALPILIATLLTKKPCQITNVPKLKDIKTTISLLEAMGAKISQEKNALNISNEVIKDAKASYELVKTMRASILVLGPLLAREKKACVSLPGGCAIGARPVDIHISGLEKMGAVIEVKSGFIHATAPNGLKGSRINMRLVSVTGTANLIMAATLSSGTTILENSAKEPEIVDLAKFLIKMGADIKGYGTNTITIVGKKELVGTDYKIMPDRIETGTFLVAAAVTKGSINCINANHEDLKSVIAKLEEAGAKIKHDQNSISIDCTKNNLKSVNITTAPHPDFPTDMQAQFMVLNSVTQGDATITETIFENRFMHAPELMRMGANIEIFEHKAICKGKSILSGTTVMATDLRASASLVIASLVAKGHSIIERIYHLDRGYEALEKKLQKLGAKIKRIN